MKILLATEDYVLKHYLEIGQVQLNYSYINSKEPIKEYQNNDFDLVIVDISNYEETFLKILKINPKQKMVVVADNLDCIDEVGCEVCPIKYNKHRLLKPVAVNTLFDLIINFNHHECNYLKTDCFKNILPIIPNILKRFITYDFSVEKNLIYKKDKIYSSNFVVDLVEIVSILDNHNTKYEIINGRDIQII